MKSIIFMANTLDTLRSFSGTIKNNAGYQLDKLQRGLQPDDYKPMPSIGTGVEEIRLRDQSGIYRVIYIARLADAVYVLHAFKKKSQQTDQRDIDTAKKRFNDLMREKR